MSTGPRALPGFACAPDGGLLDERGRPDFRDVYAYHASGARTLDVALTRIRLAAMDLGPEELGGVRRLRVLLAEINALTLAAEAETLAADPGRRGRLLFLLGQLERGLLRVRLAPLAGWAPDFSVFSFPGGSMRVLMVGPHRLERPYPHPGPAFASVHRGPAADMAASRFDELWVRGHDLREPVLGILRAAMGGFPPGQSPSIQVASEK